MQADSRTRLSGSRLSHHPASCFLRRLTPEKEAGLDRRRIHNKGKEGGGGYVTKPRGWEVWARGDIALWWHSGKGRSGNTLYSLQFDLWLLVVWTSKHRLSSLIFWRLQTLTASQNSLEGMAFVRLNLDTLLWVSESRTWLFWSSLPKRPVVFLYLRNLYNYI